MGSPGQPPQGLPSPGGAPTLGPGAPEPSSPEEKQKAGATILNALSSAIKAGIPISHSEVNVALAEMGLPPLPLPHEQIVHQVPGPTEPPSQPSPNEQVQ